MVGPTGTGKTAVASMAAESVAASMLRVSAPNWMPAGANNRGTRETISVIAEHVTRNNRTILFADEIDKLIDRGGDTSWKSYIFGELFDLLDGRWPCGLTLPETDDDSPDPTIESLTEKFQNTVFVLAAGTFQSWFDGAGTRRSMGFGAQTNSETDELSADIVAENLPRELANRFNSQLIRLPELRADDYHRIARETADKLPLRMRASFLIEVKRLIPGAIAAKKGVRFLEEAILETLMKLPPEPAPLIAENIVHEIKIHDLEPCTL